MWILKCDAIELFVNCQHHFVNCMLHHALRSQFLLMYVTSTFERVSTVVLWNMPFLKSPKNPPPANVKTFSQYINFFSKLMCPHQACLLFAILVCTISRIMEMHLLIQRFKDNSQKLRCWVWCHAYDRTIHPDM